MAALTQLQQALASARLGSRQVLAQQPRPAAPARAACWRRAGVAPARQPQHSAITKASAQVSGGTGNMRLAAGARPARLCLWLHRMQSILQAQGAARMERCSAEKCARWACPQAAAPVSKEGEVLRALSQIIDPDFGMTIVDCGFVKVCFPARFSIFIQVISPAKLLIYPRQDHRAMQLCQGLLGAAEAALRALPARKIGD